MQDSNYSRGQARFRRPLTVNVVAMKRHLALVAMNPLASEANTVGLFEQNSSAEFIRGARRVIDAVPGGAINPAPFTASTPAPAPFPTAAAAAASASASAIQDLAPATTSESAPAPSPAPALLVSGNSAPAPAGDVSSAAAVVAASGFSSFPGSTPAPGPLPDSSTMRGSSQDGAAQDSAALDSAAVQESLRELIARRALEKSMGPAAAGGFSPKRVKSSPREYDLHSTFVAKPAGATPLISKPGDPKTGVSGLATLARPAKRKFSRRTRVGLGIAVAVAVVVGAGGFAAHAVDASNREVASAKAAQLITEARLTTPDAATTAKNDKALAASRAEAHLLLGALDGYSSVFAGDVSQGKLDSLETARVALVTASLGDDPAKVSSLVAQLDTAVADAAGDMVTISTAFVPTQTAAEATVVDAANAQLGVLTAAIAAKGDVVGEMKTMAGALRILSSNNGAQLAAVEVQRQAGLAAAAVATAMATKSVVSALRKSSGPKNYVSALGSANAHSPTSSHNSTSGKTT